MKKLLYSLVILILLGLTIYLWYQNQKLRNQPKETTKDYVTDTIFLPQEFKPETPYNSTIKPKEILVFGNKEVLHDDSTHISDQDSLFQFTLERNKLQLNLFNQQTGTYSSRIFPIDLDSYQYNWYQGNLTSKEIRKPKIKPYAYAKYRVFHNLLDVGTGISFKTKKLDYNLGINAYHYPSYKKGIGLDLEVSIVYNF